MRGLGNEFPDEVRPPAARHTHTPPPLLPSVVPAERNVLIPSKQPFCCFVAFFYLWIVCLFLSLPFPLLLHYLLLVPSVAPAAVLNGSEKNGGP